MEEEDKEKKLKKKSEIKEDLKKKINDIKD